MASRESSLELRVLRALDEAPEPLGSWALCDILAREGLAVSEATCGRILREMDNRGLTERIGFRGRVLTPEGRRRLEGMTREHHSSTKGMALVQLLRAHTKDELLEVLEARRAIEGEAARLAAIRGTPEMADRMEEAVARHQAEATPEGGGSEGDALFHGLLLEAAGNRVLKAAAELVRGEAEMSPILTYIRRRVGSAIAVDHRLVVQAIRRRDGRAAREAMTRHIDNIIRDVERFWEDHAEEKSAGENGPAGDERPKDTPD